MIRKIFSRKGKSFNNNKISPWFAGIIIVLAIVMIAVDVAKQDKNQVMLSEQTTQSASGGTSGVSGSGLKCATIYVQYPPTSSSEMQLSDLGGFNIYTGSENCKDSDGGLGVSKTLGTTTADGFIETTNSNGKIEVTYVSNAFSKTDYCANPNTLIEYGCTGPYCIRFTDNNNELFSQPAHSDVYLLSYREVKCNCIAGKCV